MTYEPPLRVGFGLTDQTVTGARATMGRTILVPGAGPNPRHYHAGIDVCWYILSGQITLAYARRDGTEQGEVMLEGGDFVYIPSGAIHVISNAAATEKAALIFCYIGWGTCRTPKPFGSTEGGQGKARLIPGIRGTWSAS